MIELSIEEQVEDILDKHDFIFSTHYYGAVTGWDGWSHYSWGVTFEHRNNALKKSISLPFKMGLAHHRVKSGRKIPTPPKAAEVLYSCISDASLAGESFEDFCLNCGYDTDSRKALELYLTCQKQATDLIKVLGRPLYNTLSTLLEDY